MVGKETIEELKANHKDMDERFLDKVLLLCADQACLGFATGKIEGEYLGITVKIDFEGFSLHPRRSDSSD